MGPDFYQPTGGVLVRRGEVWWAQFDQQHPVILLSEDSQGGGHNSEIRLRAVQIVAPSGADLRGLGVEVTVGTHENLPFDGVVRVGFPRPGFIPCTWATTVGPGDLVERVGVLSAAKLNEIDEALGNGEHIVGARDAENEADQSTLAEIRQALRLGAMATRQIERGAWSG
jgi:mRNA interferase MazF